MMKNERSVMLMFEGASNTQATSYEKRKSFYERERKKEIKKVLKKIKKRKD